jgi:hypothetical protein
VAGPEDSAADAALFNAVRDFGKGFARSKMGLPAIWLSGIKCVKVDVDGLRVANICNHSVPCLKQKHPIG